MTPLKSMTSQEIELKQSSTRKRKQTEQLDIVPKWEEILNFPRRKISERNMMKGKKINF